MIILVLFDIFKIKIVKIRDEIRFKYITVSKCFLIINFFVILK